MASVTVFTAERMQQIEDNNITSADIIDGELVFQRQDGSTFNAGPVNANAVLSVQGDWNIAVPYSINDMVNHNSSTWIASEATLAGDEPGVSSKWQEFLISGASPDVTVGDHTIEGTLTFDEPPVVPPAENTLHATNLGDVQTELAQLPTILSSPDSTITFQDNLGDIEPLVSGFLTRNVAWSTGGIIFKHENTTDESSELCTGFGDANYIDNNDRFKGVAFGELFNNTGSDVTFTFRLKSGVYGGTITTLATSNIVVPSNSVKRAVRFEYLLEMFNFYNLNNLLAYGGLTVVVGAPTGTDGEVLAHRIEMSNFGSSFDKSQQSIVYVTVQMSVASTNAYYQNRFATIDLYKKEAFPF